MHVACPAFNARLKFIFGASAVPALDLVDRQSVTRVVSPSGRTVYQDKQRKTFLLDSWTSKSESEWSLASRWDGSQIWIPNLREEAVAIKVVGSSGKLYTCYASCHFCTCPAFTFSVLRKGDSLVCKHILAVYLSRALGACQELTVPDEQLTKLLLPQEDGREEAEDNTRP
ncbi:zinc finger SWIM domain-containing protein 7 isoform X1 [Sceloporus undulatus]|uniref:zinc finger SWIM domain-containing protein 7 isoform X1 n=1 Tax=Sceloporus undulatus TaxID=8520 RepID=UPI001C4AE01B|nr:zinc finger SWIM domain-containing protein 7 isoform X1 [Sceloporus undulatus]